MTTCIVFDLVDQYQLDMDDVKIHILPSSTTPQLGGTSADLISNDKLTIRQLCYAMMLPSGNDAAQSLAIYFGNTVLNMPST